MNKVVDALFDFMIVAYEYNQKKVQLQDVVTAGHYYIQCVREASRNNSILASEVDHYLAFSGLVMETILLS
jgi:hypothetical protein